MSWLLWEGTASPGTIRLGKLAFQLSLHVQGHVCAHRDTCVLTGTRVCSRGHANATGPHTLCRSKRGVPPAAEPHTTRG